MTHVSDLKHLTDENLLKETVKLVKEEREILSRLLHHLREIERRRLYSQVKCASLYEYATKELGYSEDQAYRRIQAMRLLTELPEIEEKMNSGVLNLTHLGLAQSHFKKETFSKNEKIKLLAQLESTSKRKAETIIAAQSLAPTAPIEKFKPVACGIEVKFTISEKLLEKIDRLKGLLAHKNSHLHLCDLLDLLCDLGLEKYDKASPAPAREKVGSLASLRRHVWRRAGGACQICGSGYALEIDHVRPKALGGDDTLENLRLLCRSCNQREAIKVFGVDKMERHFDEQV